MSDLERASASALGSVDTPAAAGVAPKHTPTGLLLFAADKLLLGGAPPTTQAETINADLLAWLRS